jgi:predicted dehydrogenase
MERLKVGVIGCGAFGRNGHVKGYAGIPEAEIIAVGDLDPERARETAAEFGVRHHYADYREMLERHALDVVSIATATVAVHDAAVAAFEAGANVLCSKPLAMNFGQAKGMVDAAKRAGKFLSMGLQNRFRPDVRALRDFLAAGKLGHVYHTNLSHGHIMEIPGHGSLHKRALSGGGALFHTTVHQLDAVLWVLGNPTPVRASGASYQKVSRMKKSVITWRGALEECDIEDFNVGLVHFADGSTMTVTSNWMAHPNTAPGAVVILGDWGVATRNPFRIELEDGARIVDVTPELPPGPESAFRASLQDFCQSVLEGRVPTVHFSQMLDVQWIMDALYVSADRGEEVRAAE